MKAMVWYGKKDIKINDMPEPSPGPEQVKVKIKVCGICGSDLHEYNHGPVLIPHNFIYMPERKEKYVVLGHEFSAEVVETGSKGTRFKTGDRVTAYAHIFCGNCYYCKKGQHNLCHSLGNIGLSTDGGFAEYSIVNEKSLYHLPDTVNDDMGAFTEPLAVAIRAVKRSGMKIGDTVAVVGAGPIGQLVMMVCLASGADNVFVIEPMKTRRKIAEKNGASFVVDPGKSDPGKVIAELTSGLRAYVSIDCVGNQSAFETAVKVTGKRGRICIVGISVKPFKVMFNRLLAQEKEITFSNGYEDEFSTAISMLSNKKVYIENLISARINLKDIVKKGFKPLTEDPEKNIKILVYPFAPPIKHHQEKQ